MSKNIPSITDEWLHLPNQQLTQTVAEAFAAPRQMQELLLRQIVADAAQTEIGRKFDFASIDTVEEFRRRMPLTDWTDVEPYSDRMAAGEQNLIFAGATHQFVKTSGTTGKDKLIPESARSETARALIQKLRMARYVHAVPALGEILMHPELTERRLLPLTNTPKWSTTASGIPCVSASGLTIGQSGLDRLIAFPLHLLLNRDDKSRDYLIMRMAVECPTVTAVMGNNAGRMTALIRLAATHTERILTDIEHGTMDGAATVDDAVREKLQPMLHPNPQRAEQLRRLIAEGQPFTPASYWPDLKLGLFWLSASVGRYVDELRPLLPAETIMMDVGYGASEAKFNIPWAPEDPSGVISPATLFYEFQPIDDRNESTTPLLCDELEAGRRYELIVTTWGGLYRYRMKDIVEVTGFMGRTPKIVFVTKSCEVLNICGEKLYPDVVAHPVAKALDSHGLTMRQLQIYPDYEHHNYICFVEPMGKGEPIDSSTLTEEAHRIFLSESPRYKMNVEQGVLKPLKVILVKEGWQEALYAERLRPVLNISQIKLPIVISKPIDPQWIR